MPNDIPAFFLTNPVTTGFFITDPFNSPRSYANGRHEGIDLRAVSGGRPVDIVAAQRGVVDRIRTGNSGYGNYVRVRHNWPDGTTWVTWYAHLSAIQPGLTIGQEVEIGQRLGQAGSTGNSTGVHLHLTLQHLGHGLSGYVVPDVVDPTRYFSDISIPLVDELSYLADVTVPDGSTLEAGKPFTKTWRILNSGTSTWGDGFTLEHSGDDRMGGPDSIPLPPLKPGEIAEISVDLVAPTEPGRHRTTWKGRNSRGRFFAFELYADFITSPIPRRDDAIFVADITVPDGATIVAGQQFIKTWRIRNTGDTTWVAGYSLVHVGTVANDSPMGANTVPRVPTARPGSVVEVSVQLTAPEKPGEYYSTWHLQNAEGKPFGRKFFAHFHVSATPAPTKDNAIYVSDLSVLDGTRMQPGFRFTKKWRIRNTGDTTWGDGYTLTFVGENQMAGPNHIPLPPTKPGEDADLSLILTAPAIIGPHRSAWQPHNPNGQPFGNIIDVVIEVVALGIFDRATHDSDITYPDGTIVSAGSTIVKTWRIRNSGTSAWTAGYALVFVAGRQMNGPDSVPLPLSLPGESVDVSVPLEAPLAPGLHRSTWRARNAEGQLFGDLFNLEIRVPVATTPGSTAIEDAQLEEHITYPDGSEVTAESTFKKTWAIRNTGSVPWGPGYELVFVGGTEMGETRSVAVSDVAAQGNVAAQAVVNISVLLTAPPVAGRHLSRWRMRNPRGEYFGSTMFAAVDVVEKPTKYDLLPYLRGDGRLYEMKHIFNIPNGSLIGQQRVQTQIEKDRFYTVKNSEWEEMWADSRFIYRGTDTSPGSGNFYTLMDGQTYGSVWVPRHMAIGQQYRRSVIVISRRKGSCVVNSHLSGRHVTWIILEAIHKTLALPDVEGNPHKGLVIQDVVVLAAHNEVSGRPAKKPFERYYYAKNYGLVMWEGIETDHKGISFLIELHNPGDRPDNVRERIHCFENIRP